MLLTLCNPKDDLEFKECVDLIIKAYYPPEYEFRNTNNDAFSKSSIKRIISENKELYTVYNKNKTYKFPFVDKFHTLFNQFESAIDEGILEKLEDLKKYLTEIGDDKTLEDFKIPEFERLFMPKEGINKDISYSKNYKNFNHFVNVVLATSRIIQYFTGTKGANKIAKILFKNPKYKYLDHLSDKQYRNNLCKELSYSKTEENIRIFKLMLSAFYHDIGKTIVDHRHGMEGAIILSDHNSDSWNELHTICKASIGKEFERNDLPFVADMVRYHDFFGTLSTGESGHIKFTELINVIKQFGYRDVRNGKDEIWNRKRFFDMWILNVADILVSLDEKWKPIDWLLNKAQSEKKLNEFFTFSNNKNKENHISCKIERLAHDFLDGLDVLDKVNEIMHADNNEKLIEESKLKGSNHVIERLSRLITETIDQSVKAEKKFLKYVFDEENKDKTGTTITYSKHYYKEEQIRSAVLNSITSISNYQSFIESFSIVGNLDYALGFFQTICKYSIKTITKELNGEIPKTGWIRNRDDDPIMDEDIPVTDKFNAHFFLTNYTSIVVRILAHLIYRNTLGQDIINFEFKDASDRLKKSDGTENTDKLNKLIALEGPYRSAQSIHLILESVFIY